MCIDPATATMMLTIASSALAYVGQNQQAQAQMDSIAADDQSQQAALIEQQRQINSQAADKMNERAKQAKIEQGRLRTIQGESGLSGNSQDRVLGESLFNEGTDIASIEGNREASIKQSRMQAQATRSSSRNSLASVNQPSLIGTGLQIGTAVMANPNVQKSLKKK